MRKKVFNILIVIWVVILSLIILIKVVFNSKNFWPQDKKVFQFQHIYDNGGDGIPNEIIEEDLTDKSLEDEVVVSRELTETENPLDQDIIVSGRREIDDIDKEVKLNRVSVDYLFHNKLKEPLDCRGVAVFKFKITGYGYVRDIKLLSTNIKNKSFLSEVSSDLKEWEFAVVKNREDTTDVIYPLYFHANKLD